MYNSVPYLQSNESYNPLFTKMKERFCADGTLAEKMAIEAGICKKRSKKESHIQAKEARRTGKMLFNLKSVGAVSMSLLITGVLFLSGASFNGVQKSFMATDAEAQMSESYIVSEEEVGTLYFAHESLAELL